MRGTERIVRLRSLGVLADLLALVLLDAALAKLGLT